MAGTARELAAAKPFGDAGANWTVLPPIDVICANNVQPPPRHTEKLRHRCNRVRLYGNATVSLSAICDQLHDLALFWVMLISHERP